MARRLAAVLAVVSILVLGCSTEDGDRPARQRTEPLGDDAHASGGPPPTGVVVPKTPLPAPEDPATSTEGRPYRGYPDAVAVLGGSDATGRGSDPARPGIDVRENSWATGSNPQVASVFLRLVARHPDADGHAIDLARDRATLDDLHGQARSLVALQPPDPLVVLQPIGEGLDCPASRADLDRFEEQLRATLDEIDDGLPTSRIFVVTRFGSSRPYVGSTGPARRVTVPGTGRCVTADAHGRVLPRGVARRGAAERAYGRRLARSCAAVPRCADDRGALTATRVRPSYVDARRGCLSVRGEAAEAAVAWRSMRAAGLLPARR
ncbi:hypothetical protein EKO23_04635 [Nocardioides guangzhouensis]|uniref:SGNH/GDSL hydrolase family protein n=1 Tax=Nocardioides guangzhouensis TaxID=2497878 RepID=A0A4Q4ZHK1_9ACTN|nr:hypothetical protein [Nocardioides guangzhouensis]RYP87690.1 hypothetical protein EKO23_04635 [Nocardioides guangzhouensis]